MSAAPGVSMSEFVTITRFVVTQVRGANIFDFIKMMVAEKRTGSLTINFSQGTPCSVEFREKERT